MIVEPSLHRNLLGETLELRAAIEAGAAESWLLAATEILLKRLPYPPSRQTPLDGSFFRLPLHNRAFYYMPENGSSEQEIVCGVIAVKGASALAEDFDDWLIEMQNTRMPSETSRQKCLSEHFALCEHKIPGALSLREAEIEAQVAAEVQARHLRFYKEPALLPLPLIIHRIPDDRLRKVRKILQHRLSRQAMSRIEDLMASGLATYIYYYPSVPVRVTQLDLMFPTENHIERFNAIKRRINPEEVIALWVRGFVRLMFLNYLPASLGSRGTGNCCSPKNAIIDGGFADLDSIIPMAELDDEILFEETLHYSFLSLCRTVREFLVRKTPHGTSDKDLIEKWIAEYTANLCRKALESEMRVGINMDRRVLEYFNASRPYDLFINHINYYFSPLK